MYRVTIMSGNYYAVKMTKTSEKEFEEIETFACDGVPVILVADLEDLEYLDIDVNDVQLVVR